MEDNKMKMKNKKKTNVVTVGIMVFTLVIAVCIFCTCNTSSKKTYEFTNLESQIQQNSKDFIKENFVVDTRAKDITFETNGYVIEIKQEGNLVGGINLEAMPEFFEEIQPEAPELLSTGKVTKKNGKSIFFSKRNCNTICFSIFYN